MAREVALSMAHGGDMFDPWCPTCSSRVLLTTRRLIELAPTPTGHRARLRCWCGTEVSMDVDRLGASAPAAATPDPAPVPLTLVGGAPHVPGASPTAA
jgi:hypothetical protein